MKKYLPLCSLLAASLLAIVVIKSYLLNDAPDFEGASGSTAYFPVKQNLPIHIRTLDSITPMISGYSLYGGNQSLVLWLGNSQLHLINQYQKGDKNSVEYLHDSLQKIKQFVTGYSLINANLQELFVVFRYFLEKAKINKLIIPVFFDDFRETGIRSALLLPEIGKILAKDADSSPLGRSLQTSYSFLRDTFQQNEDRKGLHKTTQERVEKFLDDKLSGVSSIWASRTSMRGKIIYNYLYRFRNTLLNIEPGTKRKKIPGRYILNMEAFDKICSLAVRNSVEMIVYIPPIRNDLEQPYHAKEYEAFQLDLSRYKDKYGFVLYDAGNIIPPAFWGLKASTRMKGKADIDFMHFQTKGHKLLADSLTRIIRR